MKQQTGRCLNIPHFTLEKSSSVADTVHTRPTTLHCCLPIIDRPIFIVHVDQLQSKLGNVLLCPVGLPVTVYIYIVSDVMIVD